MAIPTDLKKLTSLFKKLGSTHPKEWAEAQLRDPVQIYRFLFLTQAWKRVASEGDETWIDRAIQYSHRKPNDPFAGLGASVERSLAAGASRSDIAQIARCKEVQMLHTLCYLLEDPSFDDVPKVLEDVTWGLFPVVDDQPVVQRIGGLHESVLSLDPTQKEMYP